MLVIGFSMIFGWIMALEQIPRRFAEILPDARTEPVLDPAAARRLHPVHRNVRRRLARRCCS
jgi:hypothetical protein